MPSNEVIQTKNLIRRFGDTTAVDGLTLSVTQGEIFGYLGHNGAGKTTTVRLLNGVLTPTDGEARVLGLSPARQGAELRRRTGVLTETHSLDERLTARENLEIFADLYGVPVDEVAARIEHYLTLFGLMDRADDKVGSYSKGMKQRLALVRALLHHPEIIFLDEPTSGLDPVSTRQVHEMILRMSHEEGRTVFLTTHNLAEAQKLCDRVGVLERGRLIALGTPGELAQRIVQSLRLELDVAVEDKEKAISRLESMHNGLQVESGPNGSMVLTGVKRDDIPDVVAGLTSGGVRIYRVAQQEPSLEDVYFALHS